MIEKRFIQDKCFSYGIFPLIMMILQMIFFCNSQIIESLSDEEKTKRCSNTYAKTKYDCNLYTTQSTYCCYLFLSNEIAKLYNNTLKNNFCLSLEKERYNKLGNINYMNVNYRIDCGVGTQVFSSLQSSQAGANCGVNNPQKPSDCFATSSIDNNCCYYKISNITGCFYLGAKYSGIYKDDEGVNFYECTSDFLKINSFKNILLLIYVVLFII